MKCDLVVIGGGLAGLALAILEARAGQQVLLCEQKQYPAHKVCGEYISLESWRFLNLLGLPLNQWDLPQISRLELTSPRKRIQLPLDYGGFGLSRYKAEAALVELAKAAGVAVHTNCKVHEVEGSVGSFIVQASQGNFSTNWVAGSWGRRSNLYQQAPQARNYVGVKWHLQGNLPADLIALHNFRGGYAGMSRIEDGLSCFCYLVDSRRLQEAGKIEMLEAAMMAENQHLRQMRAPLEAVWEKPLTISQVSFSPKTTAYQGVLLLGDAAGSIAPLAGNGMSMALHAAWLLHCCWESEGRGVQQPELLYTAYAKAWQKQFALRTAVSYRIQHLFGQNSLTHALLTTIEHFPWLGKNLMRLTHGHDFIPKRQM
ncbi:MAG: NAD(P)/FAD-dependent oxidoreductase [Bacteroidia bacterium]